MFDFLAVSCKSGSDLPEIMPVNADAVPTEGLEFCLKRFEGGDLGASSCGLPFVEVDYCNKVVKMDGASSAASRVEPSLHSPSLKRVTTLWGMAFILEANAKPVAIDKPWPKEPVAASIPGTQRGDGCSGNGEPV